jgi:hypothetical protein
MGRKRQEPQGYALPYLSRREVDKMLDPTSPEEILASTPSRTVNHHASRIPYDLVNRHKFSLASD